MKEKSHLNFHYPRKNDWKAEQLIESASQKSSIATECEQRSAEASLLSQLSVLFSFSFAGCSYTFDTYSTFRYESVHCLSLNVRRETKECIVYLLGEF